jgi:Fis family transcriptional regulator, factor for inversion stimulation protein
MFRDHDQASRAIRLLLAASGLSGLWSDSGPAPAILLRYEADLPLPPGKRALLLAAWSLWSPAAAGITLGEVVRDLDPASCAALCSLILAYKGGAGAVDAWIEAAATPSPEDHAREPPAAPALDAPAQEEPPRDDWHDWPTLDALSLRYVGRVLERVKDNRTRAAEVLGVDRRTVSRLVAAAREGQPTAMKTQQRRGSRSGGRRKGADRRG